MKKEIACPHCGQDLQLPAYINAERLALLERIAEAAQSASDEWDNEGVEIVDGLFFIEKMMKLKTALEAYEAAKG